MNEFPDRKTVKARWIFPVTGPPIENGFVEVEDGYITAVHRSTPSSFVDLGNVAILPGLVNAHVHLEFSLLNAPLQPPLPFTDWIQSVMAYRNTLELSDSTSITEGLEEVSQSGTVAIGEITTNDLTSNSLSDTETHVVAFRELIGFRPDRVGHQIENAGAHIQTCRSIGVSPGLSPHAPYSVHPNLLRQAVDLARREHIPVAMHLAETRDEIDFVRHGRGEFVALLEQLGIWQSGYVERLDSIEDYLQILAEADRALAIHCNYLTESEIDFLTAHSHIHAVYCPRTHSYFQHPPHAWRQLMERGASVAIGTDGSCSNPDLNMWREAGCLWRNRESLAPAKILELVTLSGARALGVESSHGSIEVGKSANLARVDLSLTSAEGSGDPYDCLFAATNCSRFVS